MFIFHSPFITPGRKLNNHGTQRDDFPHPGCFRVQESAVWRLAGSGATALRMQLQVR